MSEELINKEDKKINVNRDNDVDKRLARIFVMIYILFI